MVIFDKLAISEDGRELQIKAHVDTNPYFKDEYIQKLCIDTDKTFVSCGISSKAIYKKEYNEEVPSSSSGSGSSSTETPSFEGSTLSLKTAASYDEQSGIAIPKKVAVFDSSSGTLAFSLDASEEPDTPTPGTPMTGVKEINEVLRIEDPAFYAFEGKNFNDNLFFIYIKTNGLVGNAPCNMSSSLNMAVVYKSDRFFQTILNTAKDTDSCEIPRHFLNFAILYDLFKACLDFGYMKRAIEIFHKLTKNRQSKSIGGCGCGRTNT